jgi:hypothetical protein
MPAERFDAELPAELKAVENALRELTPSLGQLNRDRLMYLAGQASALNSPQSVPRQIAWPLATAALTLISLTLGGFLIFTQRGGERIVYVDRPTTVPSPTTVAMLNESSSSEISHHTISAGPSYFELRDLVLTKGLDAMPMPETTNEKSALLDSLSWPALRDELLRGKIGG